jgi:hypothetical protein
MVNHVQPSKWGSCTLAPAVALFDQQPHRCPVSGNVLFEDQMYADVDIRKIVMLSVIPGLPIPSNPWVLRSHQCCNEGSRAAVSQRATSITGHEVVREVIMLTVMREY